MDMRPFVGTDAVRVGDADPSAHKRPFQPSTTHYTDTIHEAETEPSIPVRNINELINPTNHA